MTTMSKKSSYQNVSITPEQEEFIAALARHRITGPELIRGLLDAAMAFYHEHGWFSFPATITPEKFQNTKAPSAEEKAAVAPERVQEHQEMLGKLGRQNTARFQHAARQARR